MGLDERQNVGEERVTFHGAILSRVATRTSTQNAGCVPLLRDVARWQTMAGMKKPDRIDVPKLRRDVLAWLEKNPDETRRGLSLAASAGRNPDVIRDLFRVDKRMPTYATVAALAEVIGEDVGSYVTGGLIATQAETWLTVSGAVVAGVWREQCTWHREDWYQIRVDGLSGTGEIGFVVEGRSMDRTLPPGTILRCVDVFHADHPPESGDYVIVEQKRGDLYQVTCKRLNRRFNGEWELICESSLAEFQEPILLGQPFDENDNFDPVIDDEIRVKCIVIDAYLPLRRRITRAVPSSG